MHRTTALPALVLLAAGATAIVLPPAGSTAGVTAHDIYAQFYPNMLYALRSAGAGGRGLLWIPYQNCGQPFFGNPLTGLLYPPHVLFLVLSPGIALRAVTIVNLCIAGLGMYRLARILGAGVFGALAGALVFQLGNTSLMMASWSPMHAGPFAWFPWAMYASERLLVAPDRRAIALLGGVLALAFLPGFPFMVALMGFLVALRVAWELVLRRTERPGAVVLATAGALLLSVLLAAMQLLPSVEFARASVRSSAIPFLESDFLSVAKLRLALGIRMAGVPLMLVGWMLVAAAPLRRETRPRALFYLLAAGVLFALAFGVGARFYATLPAASLIRSPARFFWAIDVCLAAAAALGADALAQIHARRTVAFAATVVLPAAALLAIDGLMPGGLLPREWALAAAVLLVPLGAALVPRLRPLAGPMLVATVVLNARVAPFWHLQSLLPTDAPLFEHEAAFARVRSHLTANDRIFLVHQPASATGFALMAKSPTVFRTPSLSDYEPLVSRRWADYIFFTRFGRPLTDPNESMFGYGAGADVNRRLLDLAAARYLVVDPAIDSVSTWTAPPPRLLVTTERLRVYDNPTAWPRARFVPHVEVVPDPASLLRRLATGRDDLAEMALVETPPVAGTLRDGGAITAATVDFVRDDPERIVLHVVAPRPGFVLLADQHYPGWRATVNGRATPIERANYVFRLVAVPAGASTVEFRFRPASVLVGGLISLATLIAVAVALRRPARRAVPGLDAAR